MKKLNVKVIKKFKHHILLGNQLKPFYLVIIQNDPTNVSNYHFTNAHYYDVEAKHLHDYSYYREPFDKPDYNLRSDFNKYRSIKHYLQPDEIKQQRLKRHLSLRNLSNLTGIDYGSLSEIENNHVVQNYEQDTLLEFVFNTKIKHYQDYPQYKALKARIGDKKASQLAKKLVSA